MKSRATLLCLLLPCSLLASEPDPVALTAGQPSPYAGVLLSRVRLATLAGKAAALKDLQAALDARTKERDIQARLAADYHAEADAAVRAAKAQRAKNRVDRAKGFVAGVSVGHLVVRALGWLVGKL